MSDFSLTLGPVAFAGFELPSSITIGGRQRLAIHRLPGGIRVIDALGPDAADIHFSGIFTGPDAADRTRLLDGLRVAGGELPLVWDAFTYTVVIESCEADYRSPWWIPYRLSCAVVRDEAALLVTAVAPIASSITSDVLTAGSIATSAAEAVGVPGSTVAGTSANVAAMSSLATTLGTFDTQIATTTATLGTASLTDAVAAAGLLAQLTTGRGYAARAARNLALAGS